MYPRTRLIYFYFLRVELLLKTWSQGRRHIVRLPWQRYICRSKYGCFCLSPKVTYLHTKIEEGLKFFISNFASLSWRIALNFSRDRRHQTRNFMRRIRISNVDSLLKRLENVFSGEARG